MNRFSLLLKSRRLTCLGCLGCLAILLISGCEPPPPPAAIDQSVRPARLYRVTPVSAGDRHQFVGRVEAARTVDMSFQVPGMITAFQVLEGQEVDQDSPIANLDPEDYELAVREALVQLNIARQDYQRKQSLLKDKGISESQVDDARALYELRGVHLAQARERLDDTRLTAPFRAYVSKRFVDDQVNVSAGQPVVRLLDLNTLHIIASIPENLVATVTPARVSRLSARFPFLPDQRFPLEIRENSGEAGDFAQTYEVTFAMERPSEWNILPGMTATVEIELHSQGNTTGFLVPQSALVTEPDESYFVWRYSPDTGEIEQVPVIAGAVIAGGVLVQGALGAEDLIVSAGAHLLSPGMKIRPLNPTGD